MSEKDPGEKDNYRQEIAARRKRAVRTALVMAFIAVAVFVGFIWIVSTRG